jgi:serine protease Do
MLAAPLLLLVVTLAAAPAARAAAAAAAPATQDLKALYDRVTPSLVAVQFVWENELSRQEINGAGIVVSADGLVMTSLSMFDIPTRGSTFRVPDAQLKDFKILIPSQEHEADEIDAVFAGRDDRTGTAFVRAKSSADAKHKWTPLKFEDLKPGVGDAIVSVGLLPKNAAYKSYLTRGTVAANLRGEVPQVLVVGGGLAGMGAPVFNAKGQAIGLVNTQPGQTPFLNEDRSGGIATLINPPIFFVPAGDFLQSISDPPVAGEGELKLPWLGVPQQAMAGLNKDVAESLGLKDVPAVEIGDVIPGSPIATAGIKAGNIITKVNGKPLERGDEPEELPGILARQIRRMKVGDTVKLTVLTAKDQTKDIDVKLTERPKGANLAERWYADDLGFGVRELVFMDSYVRKLPQDTKGVVVSIVKPQGAASAAKLQSNDLISELNGEAITSLEDFKKQFQTIRKDKPKEAIVLVVLRDANTQTIRIEPPQ